MMRAAVAMAIALGILVTPYQGTCTLKFPNSPPIYTRF